MGNMGKQTAGKRRMGRRVLAVLLCALLAACGAEGDGGPAARTPPASVSVSASDKEENSEARAPGESSASTSAPNETREAAGKSAPETQALPPLHVEGTGLADPEGRAVVLRGVSTHGLAWFPAYVNEDCFRQLREEWNANVVRLAMYTAESGGYCAGGDKERLKQLIRDGVRYAKEQKLYVIVDWHILSDGDPNAHAEEAKAFFDEMCAEFAGETHVLYEICNEPNGGVTWQSVKQYAQQIIPVIRARDADAVILVGSPTWSQDVDQAAADPITGYDNLLYTLHFYAATHKDFLRERLRQALDADLPVFVSEFGICDASGGGAIDEAEADKWMALLDEYGVGRVAWSLCNKNESAALLKSACDKISGFTADDLSASGRWLVSMLTGEPPAVDASAPASLDETAGAGSAAPPSEGVTLTADGLTAELTVVNSWTADGKSVAQYSLTLNNISQTACARWEIDIPFDGAFTLLDGWNGEFTAGENTLHIASKEYNGAIPAGSSTGDIGFIAAGARPIS